MPLAARALRRRGGAGVARPRRSSFSARAAGARSGAVAAAGTSARAAGHGRDSPRGASARGAMQQEIREQRRGSAGTALLRAAQVRGAGDIQMRPFEALREFAEEPGGGDRAAVTAADVGEVREVALELLAVLFGERQLPAAVVRAPAGLHELPHQRVIVAEHTGVVVAERDDAGAGERGNVEDRG